LVRPAVAAREPVRVVALEVPAEVLEAGGSN